MSKNVLVFCVHPDDQVLGPGGTLARYAKEGLDVHIVIFSYGEMSHPHIKQDIIVDKKIKEANAACVVLGGKSIEFLGYKDSEASSGIKNPETKKKIRELIKKHDPAKIFTHYSQDPVPVNRAVSKLILSLVDEMNLSSEVYTFEVWSLFKRRTREFPKMIVDVSETFRDKIDAMKCFRNLGILKITVYGKALINGLRNEMRFAEVFRKER